MNKHLVLPLVYLLFLTRLLGFDGAWAAPLDKVADAVVGQSDLTTTAGDGTSSVTPGGIAVDATSGRLFATDINRHRVISWSNAASFTNGQDADLVFGQADLAGGDCNRSASPFAPTTANTLCLPSGVATDATGRLYVADRNNNRVVRYSPPFTNGMNADLVFGQTDFANRSCNRGAATPSAASLCSPQGVTVDGSGNVYAVDSSNGRVLRYDSPFTNGMNATLVVGRADFVQGFMNCTNAQFMCVPVDAFVDSAGNIFVAETHRVLRFSVPLSNGKNADLVLGQADFSAPACNRSSTATSGSVCFPVALDMDSTGSLYVADRNNNRVLRYSPPFTDGMNAGAVFGQPDFTTVACNTPTASNLCSPVGVGVDASGNLYVGAGLNRVLRYDQPFGPPALNCSTTSLQSAVDAAQPGSTITVLGPCNQNILIRNEKQRITIDGSGAGPGTRATIMGGGSSPVFNVRGKGIVIQNFTITGGSHGVHVNRGSNAIIFNNVIQSTGGDGVKVEQLSFASLANNLIENNPSDGVSVQENATTRIGFNSDIETVPGVNTIQNNGGRGIKIGNRSHARIIGNTISGNGEEGVLVERDASADIASNDIKGNLSHGIKVEGNSFVMLGEDSGFSMFEEPNDTTVNNVGAGVRCDDGSVVDGRLGTLTGNGGPTDFDSSCVNSLI